MLLDAATRSCYLILLLDCAIGDGRFDVRSRDAAALEDVQMHCSGALVVANDSGQRASPASTRGHSCAHAAHVCSLYDGFSIVGLQYGPGYRTLACVWGGASDALARLRARATREGTAVHPADLDDALCTGAAIASSGSGEARLPFAVDDALLRGTPGAPSWAVRRVATCAPLCLPVTCRC